MRYILEDNVSISKWKNMVLCRIGDQKKGFRLSPEEYKELKSCDGRTEHAAGNTLYGLEALRVIRRCREEEMCLKPVQINEYPNIFIANIDWTITDRCNYNCLHCFHASDNKMQREEFSLEEAFRLLSGARECGIRGIRLTGGEPTLWPWFWELLQELRDHGPMLKTLITNGALLDKEAVDRIRMLHPAAEIMISFDGIGAHDWLRQHEGSEERVKEAIRLCKEAGLRVKINMNVNRRNRAVIHDSVNMLAGLRVDEIRIIKTTEAPRWQLNQADNSLSVDEYYDFSCRFAEKYKESGLTIPVMIWQSLYLNGHKKVFSILPVKSSVSGCRDDAYICNAMMRKISIQANGDIIPCAPLAGLFTLRNIHMGNVRHEGLQKLLTAGPLVEQITGTVGAKRRADLKCGGCRYFNNCQGGCPALGMLFHGSLLSADDYKCAFFEKGWNDRFSEVLEGWRNINPIMQEA